jgi:hypothetical protein
MLSRNVGFYKGQSNGADPMTLAPIIRQLTENALNDSTRETDEISEATTPQTKAKFLMQARDAAMLCSDFNEAYFSVCGRMGWCYLSSSEHKILRDLVEYMNK